MCVLCEIVFGAFGGWRRGVGLELVRECGLFRFGGIYSTLYICTWATRRHSCSVHVGSACVLRVLMRPDFLFCMILLIAVHVLMC